MSKPKLNDLARIELLEIEGNVVFGTLEEQAARHRPQVEALLDKDIAGLFSRINKPSAPTV